MTADIYHKAHTKRRQTSVTINKNENGYHTCYNNEKPLPYEYDIKLYIKKTPWLNDFIYHFSLDRDFTMKIVDPDESWEYCLVPAPNPSPTNEFYHGEFGLYWFQFLDSSKEKVQLIIKIYDDCINTFLTFTKANETKIMCRRWWQRKKKNLAFPLAKVEILQKDDLENMVQIEYSSSEQVDFQLTCDKDQQMHVQVLNSDWVRNVRPIQLKHILEKEIYFTSFTTIQEINVVPLENWIVIWWGKAEKIWFRRKDFIFPVYQEKIKLLEIPKLFFHNISPKFGLLQWGADSESDEVVASAGGSGGGASMRHNPLDEEHVQVRDEAIHILSNTGKYTFKLSGKPYSYTLQLSSKKEPECTLSLNPDFTIQITDTNQDFEYIIIPKQAYSVTEIYKAEVDLYWPKLLLSAVQDPNFKWNIQILNHKTGFYIHTSIINSTAPKKPSCDLWWQRVPKNPNYKMATTNVVFVRKPNVEYLDLNVKYATGEDIYFTLLSKFHGRKIVLEADGTDAEGNWVLKTWKRIHELVILLEPIEIHVLKTNWKEIPELSVKLSQNWICIEDTWYTRKNFLYPIYQDISDISGCSTRENHFFSGKMPISRLMGFGGGRKVRV